tara:strand:- start:854 stop:1120 length:267 start_codon:yes stop_codon:yes gene_type:complete
MKVRKKNKAEIKKDCDDLFDNAMHMEHTAAEFVDHIQMFEGDYLMSEWNKFLSAQQKLSIVVKRFQQNKIGNNWGEDVSHQHFYEEID